MPRRLADPDRRIRVGLAVMLFVLSLFAGRLFQLQGIEASALASDALKERTVSEVLPAHRGDITDASGAVLARTVERRTVIVDQNLVPRYTRLVGQTRTLVGVQGAAEDLSPLLGVKVAELVTRLTGTSKGAVIAKDVPPERARRIFHLGIPGLASNQDTRRTFPGGTLAANLLGTVNAEGKGVGGVEQALDATLAGTPGLTSYERGVDGTRIPTGMTREVEPRPGGNVRLTIDRDIQWQAEQLVSAQAKAAKAESVSIVALDPRSGNVLAMATAPSFDPNGLRPGQVIANRVIRDGFEPGSTSKVITMAAALEEAAVTPLTRITVPERLKRADRWFRDAEPHPVQRLTVAGVLAKSSNMGTILAGEKVAPQTMERYMRLFGFGSLTGIGLPEEQVPPLAPAASWDASQRYTVLFGQGVAVTALQAAQVFATIANNGVRLPPRIIAGHEEPGGGGFRAAATAPGVRAVSERTALQMREMMEGVVVEGGTAVKAAVDGYLVAGKTGTANKHNDDCGCYKGYTASFIGMAPADDPRVVIAVIAQDPKPVYFGGEVAAPLFKTLMSFTLKKLAVPPSGAEPADIPTRWP